MSTTTTSSLPRLGTSSSTTTLAESTSTTASSSAGSSTTTNNGSSSSSSGLPQLGATKSSSSSTASMPKIVATTSTSTQTWETPTITPPSAADNPNIWKSNMPSGLVFIAVGAVAGFIFLVFLLILLITRLIANRNAKKSVLILDSSSFSSGGGGSGEKPNPFYSHLSTTSTNQMKHNPYMQNKIPLLYNESSDFNSSTDVSDVQGKNNEANFYSTLSNPDDAANKRKSMFLSPTAEVMSFNKKQNYHQRLMGSSTNLSSVYTESPSQVGHRHLDSIDSHTDISLQPQNENNQREGSSKQKAARRTVPSAYLESMFEDD